MEAKLRIQGLGTWRSSSHSRRKEDSEQHRHEAATRKRQHFNTIQRQESTPAEYHGMGSPEFTPLRTGRLLASAQVLEVGGARHATGFLALPRKAEELTRECFVRVARDMRAHASASKAGAGRIGDGRRVGKFALCGEY
ncbi:hypothetical protein BJY52DRAFT_1415118 [Lactarius psammicola]|nr:hypothetical protein BJY52DRAFT_1415118 [Lactarius psammicola]